MNGLMLVGLLISALTSASGCRAGAQGTDGDALQLGNLNRVSYTRLQTLLMDEADQSMYVLAQAYDDVLRSSDSSSIRETLARAKIAMASGLLTHASSPNPQVGLIDMVVQISLERSVAHRFASEQHQSDTAPIIEAYDKTHQQVWDLAAKLLSPRQLVDLQQLIDDWIARNPNERYVSMVRFADFSDTRRSNSLSGLNIGTTLAYLTPLSTVDTAAQQVELTRMAWERSVYLLQRMPQLIRWQANALTYQVLDAPELRQTLQSVQGVQSAATRIAASIESFPAHLETQQDHAQELLKETREVLADANVTAGRLIDAGRQYESTADRVAGAAAEFRAGAEVVDRVFARLSTPTTQPMPTEVDKYQTAFAQLSAAAKDIGESSRSIRDAVADPSAKNAVDQVARVAEQRIGQATDASRALVDHLAWRMIQVAGVVCAMTFSTVMLLRLTRRPSTRT